MKHSQEIWDQKIEEQFEKDVNSSTDLTVKCLYRILIEIRSIKENLELLKLIQDDLNTIKSDFPAYLKELKLQ